MFISHVTQDDIHDTHLPLKLLSPAQTSRQVNSLILIGFIMKEMGVKARGK